MTVGGSGGSPKTIQTVDFVFPTPGTVTNTLIYTCPADTLALIKPLAIYSNGSRADLNQDFLIRITDPTTGGNQDTPLGNSAGTSLQPFFIIPPATLIDDLIGRYNNNQGNPGTYPKGKEFFMHPGEQLLGGFFTVGATSGKFRYILQEFGIAT